MISTLVKALFLNSTDEKGVSTYVLKDYSKSFDS
jgi:hypothetical protein